jgi:cyclopropane fatty-acyl-phospholipid synthase-like methyltransferase
MENAFVKNTHAEVDFMEEELAIRPGSHLLDVGCGTGRHSVELARRGYRVTGIDLSEDMLKQARSAAATAGVSGSVDFIQGDATTTVLDARLDAAICICEGAFSLLTPDADPIAHHAGILRNIHAMVKPGGRLLLNALSAFRYIRMHSDDDVAAGRFDPLTITETSTYTLADGSEVTVREKGFMPAELRALVEAHGFRVLHLWGGMAGAWNREIPKLDEYELMVIAERD